MIKSSHSILATVFFLATLTAAAYPTAVSAQAPQNEQLFNRRMESRIDAVQLRIRRLRQDLDEGAAQDDRPRSGGSGTNAGLHNSLDALEKQCEELERELRRMGMSSIGTPYDIYEQQRRMEYNVYVLERRAQDMRRWIRPARDDDEDPVNDVPAQPEEPDDGISDEDWAEEWAKGGD
jgi:hypothetical protein